MVKRPILEVIGENIEKYYKQKDYNSLTQFSRIVGMDSYRMNLIFEGKYKLYVEKVEEIAVELGVTVIDLVEDWSD